MRRALLLVPLLVLPACGSDDPEADPKVAFVSSAEAVCTEARGERKALTTPTTASAIVPYVDEIVAILVRAQQDLAALELPPDDADEIRDKLLDPLAADVKTGQEFAAKVKAASPAQLLGLVSNRPKTTVDLEWAKGYGLEVCAEAASS